ncbi:hypothetical protein [Paractinoplanes toevensis]|uniref:hypothetical protein n=1 Tax=Paractinoplanes toevensis TaxID=571911 RepID=UPI001BB3A0BC|nr:hypothetical protein [Actinoplanes toevensis]
MSYVVAHSHTGSKKFHLIAGTQLLAQPSAGLVLDVSLYVQQATLPHLSSTELHTLRDLPTDTSQAETVMSECADAILTEAVPYLDEYGTLQGQANAHEALVGHNPLNSNAHQRLCYIRLLLGDIHGCLAAADVAQRTARDDGRDWALEIADRVDQIADLASHSLKGPSTYYVKTSTTHVPSYTFRLDDRRTAMFSPTCTDLPPSGRVRQHATVTQGDQELWSVSTRSCR